MNGDAVGAGMGLEWIGGLGEVGWRGKFLKNVFSVEILKNINRCV